MKLVLATKSPFRKKIMEFTGFDFSVDGADVDENFDSRPDDPKELVRILSRLKAEAVAEKYDDAIVVGLDSAGFFNGRIIEKPKSYEEAFQRLKSFSGNQHSHHVGVTVINTKTSKIYQEVTSIDISFRELSDEEIKTYLEEDDKYLKISLGYDPFEERVFTFIDNIKGDFNTMMGGIPVGTVIKMIKQAQGEY